MMRRRNLFLLTLYITISLIALIIGCRGNTTNCTYIEFAFSKDDPRFSVPDHVIHKLPLFTFEYPSCFSEVPITDDIGDAGITYIAFLRAVKGKLHTTPESALVVIAETPASWRDTSGSDAIEKELSAHEKEDSFNVIERKIVDIVGLPVEYMMYSFHVPVQEGFGFPAYDRVVRFASFDYNGFVWKIEAASIPDESQEMENYFNHILQTFKILP
jgi:hypothetical protein